MRRWPIRARRTDHTVVIVVVVVVVVVISDTFHVTSVLFVGADIQALFLFFRDTGDSFPDHFVFFCVKYGSKLTHSVCLLICGDYSCYRQTFSTCCHHHYHAAENHDEKTIR